MAGEAVIKPNGALGLGAATGAAMLFSADKSACPCCPPEEPWDEVSCGDFDILLPRTVVVSVSGFGMEPYGQNCVPYPTAAANEYIAGINRAHHLTDVSSPPGVFYGTPGGYIYKLCGRQWRSPYQQPGIGGDTSYWPDGRRATAYADYSVFYSNRDPGYITRVAGMVYANDLWCLEDNPSGGTINRQLTAKLNVSFFAITPVAGYTAGIWPAYNAANFDGAPLDFAAAAAAMLDYIGPRTFPMDGFYGPHDTRQPYLSVNCVDCPIGSIVPQRQHYKIIHDHVTLAVAG